MDYLKRSQKNKFVKPPTMAPTVLNKKYHHKMNIKDMFTDLILLQSQNEDGEPYNHSPLREVMDNIRSIDSCKVFMTGKGGIGKTTLLRYIAYNWATNSDITFADKLVFLVSLRDIKAGKTILDAIVQQVNVSLRETNLLKNPNIIKQFIQNHKNELVFLFDGLDELNYGAESSISIFEDPELIESTVILTSRQENNTLISSSDIHVKVEGFNKSSIKQYIYKHFVTYTKQPEFGQHLIEAFNLTSPSEEDWGGNFKEVFELCSFPFLLVKICTIWTQTQQLPADLTELYKSVFCCILNQYINRSGNDKPIPSFERIPMKYTSAILALGVATYKGLQTNVLSIDKDEITEAIGKESADFVLELGFVYEEEPSNEDDFIERYTAPHKLLSEALAGFYLSYQIQQGSLDADECEMIRSNEYLHMTRVFTLGFLGKNAAALMKHWSRISGSNFFSLIYYLQFVKEEHRGHVIKVLCLEMSDEMIEFVTNLNKSLSLINENNGKKMLYKNENFLQNIMEFIEAYKVNEFEILSTVEYIIYRTGGEQSENICKLVAHILFLHSIVNIDTALVGSNQFLIKSFEKWGDKSLIIISSELEKYYLSNMVQKLVFSDLSDISGVQLCGVLQMFPNLITLDMKDCNLSSQTLMTMINECKHGQVFLDLENLHIGSNDLEGINGTTLAHLLKMPRQLDFVDMRSCNLSFTAINDMLDEFGALLENTKFALEDNNNYVEFMKKHCRWLFLQEPEPC